MSHVYEKTYQYAKDAVSIAVAGLTTLAAINVMGRKLLCFHFNPVTNNIDDFDVLIQAHEDATAVDITPTWTALAAGSRFLFASGDLAAVAAAGAGYFEMDVSGLAIVTIKASAATGASSVTPRWSLQ